MNKQIIVVIVWIVSMYCFTDVATACSCIRTPSPCSSLKGTPVVFVGLVTSVKEDTVDTTRFGQKETVRIGLLARFSVEEPLKGITQKTVEVATGGGGGDCGYPFEAGKRYLVYAYGSEDAALNSTIARTVIGGQSTISAPLSTGICGRTRPLEYASDDIELIRALNNGKPQLRIFGRVEHFARKLGIYEHNIARVGPLPDLKVQAEGASGRFETTTDRDGHYAITDITPGRYRVRVLFPRGYGPLFNFESILSLFEITPESCGLEFNFEAQVDGRISGHVLDADGSPAMDQVQVSIVSLESSTKGIALAESRSAYTKNNGWYEFEGLLPGKYLLGVNIAAAPAKHSPYPTVYYPNTSDRTQAQVFTLTLGQGLRDIDFHLPPKLTEITVSGTVVGSNGRSVAEAGVDIFDREDANQLLFGMNVKTDKEGRFTIRCFKGRQYLLHAWKDQDYLAGTGEQSEMIDLDTTDAAKPIKLVLNKVGIFIEKK